MPLNTLLLSCLVPGTSYGESGTGARVSIQAETRETILFFATDNNQIRQLLGISGPVCDLVVFYDNEQQQKILCMVELKGSDLKQAVEQVVNTRDVLAKKLDAKLQKFVVWKAYVLMTGTVPQEHKQLKTRLEKAFGAGNYAIDVSRKSKGKKKEKSGLEILVRC